MTRSIGFHRLRRLIGGNVAVATTACLAPLLVTVGELTDHERPPPAKAAQAQIVVPPVQRTF